jgi:hypothetical protein
VGLLPLLLPVDRKAMPQPRIVRLVKIAEILGVTHQRTPVADQRGADPVSSVENSPHV